MLEGLKDGLITAGLAALPFTELRTAIPFAQGVLGMEPLPSFFWGVLGNTIPVIVLLKGLGPLSVFLAQRSPRLQELLLRIFARTRRKSGVVEKYGWIGLLLFVAIPLPGTGAWTGCFAAFLFGIPFVKAASAIIAAIIILGAGVAAATHSSLAAIDKLIP